MQDKDIQELKELITQLINELKETNKYARIMLHSGETVIRQITN